MIYSPCHANLPEFNYIMVILSSRTSIYAICILQIHFLNKISTRALIKFLTTAPLPDHSMRSTPYDAISDAMTKENHTVSFEVQIVASREINDVMIIIYKAYFKSF